jgi:DNA-binding response OmpR family regulator
MENGRRKIIYVDNVDYGLITVKNMLEGRYDVNVAQTIDILFHMLEDMKPDLILLDVKISGAEELILSNDGCYSGIPIVIVTSKNNKESEINGKILGAAAYISKPFSAELLNETIENVLNLGKGKSQLNDTDEKLRILSVDDAPSILRAIAYALHDKYEVYTLSKSAELKDFLRGVKPDLFLLDCNMPEISGFDLIPIIRGFPEHKETPIIFLTSDRVNNDIRETLGLGAYDYIVKPFEPKDLRDAVEKHLKRRATA